MPQLILQPTFNDKTRAEIEAHLEEVRTRRMSAAIEYATGRHLKLSHESEVIQRRVEQQLLMLGKDIARLDNADASIRNRLEKIEELYSQMTITEDMLQHAAEAAQAEGDEYAVDDV